MDKRVVLVTGANGGLGQAIARFFLEQSPNDHVYLGVRSNRDHAIQLSQAFVGRCEYLDLDVTKPEAWSQALGHILSQHQRLDVLINNAGGQEDMLLATMSYQDWKRVVESNLDGVFLGCQAVIKTMVGQRFGRIINIASLSALLAPAGQTNYAAAKAGVVALTQSLAKEVARLGITVNAVCPGYIDTEALAGLRPEERKAAQAKVPMRRFGRPEEVAAAVHFLACPHAAYITGSALKIDGGIM